jgi:hypothetical protein
MEWIKLDSRLIAQIAYLEDNSELHIKFQNGREKVFSNINKNMFENLRSAESPGFYYATYISEHDDAKLGKRSH